MDKKFSLKYWWKHRHVCAFVYVLLKIASQLLHATSGPVKAVEGSLHQWRHDAAHVHLISTTVPLTIVLHPQPVERQRERGRWGERRWTSGDRWGEEQKEGGHSNSLIRYRLRWPKGRNCNKSIISDCCCCLLLSHESRLEDIIMAITLTHVRSRGPPQMQKRNRPRGSKCSSLQDGTCPSLGRNLGNQERRQLSGFEDLWSSKRR